MTVNLLIENKIIYKNQFKNRTSRFRFFLQTLSYLPIFYNMMLPIFERTTLSEIKQSRLS